MPIRNLKTQIARLPEQPGVYLYSNGQGETLYVGKARVLRDRVRSYLGAYGTSPRIDALLDEAERLEVIVTDSVVEALALENNLIKQRSPKYNILLRDDKTYPYLQLTTGESFARVLVARRVERDDNFYAGPFMPAALARRTMSLTHKLFGLRSCNEVITGERARPCLEYDIKRCIAPCVRAICSEEEYRAAVEHTRMFLEGRNDELLVTLRERMSDAAAVERFEQAAQLRDAIRTIETLRTRQQKMASPELGDRDAFGLKLGPAGAVVQIFQMRGGKVVERTELVTEFRDPERAVTGLPDHATAILECDVLQAALQQFYAERTAAPEVHIPIPFPAADTELLEGWLSGEAGRRVRLLVPKRGEKRGLLELASRNAQVAYQARFNENVAANYDALETLRAVLALPAVPRRIECFDISTIQGSETVASMVVCEDGRMKRSEYRKFRIKGDAGSGWRLALGEHQTESARAMIADTRESAETPAPAAVNNDFAAMHEVVLRRYRKLLEAGGPFPDLILIDGGKGQLSAAYAALQELGLANLVAVGIAKKEELLFTRDRGNPIALSTESPALLLIQRIRDEAHRFAVTFHRLSRTKRDFRSELDAIGGIGPRRRKSLLTAFGSLAGVRRATREELMKVVGAKAADAVLTHFAREGR
ncbi:MAG TPA: excinuclease ABC subunit UvrC [Vicinamibacterales bacterium]|nr:excinuclease ABC subunit UvrC [Vicinamibacterales bacterium]